MVKGDQDIEDMSEECKGIEPNNEEGIPTKETEWSPFQIDYKGNFRIVIKGKDSLWSPYDGIASLYVDNKLYIGVSQFYTGILPTECPLIVQRVDEYGDPGYVNVKIYSFTTERYLDDIEVKELFDELLFQGEYYYQTFEHKEDWIKIKILNLYQQNRSLEPDEIKDLLLKSISIEEYQFQVEGVGRDWKIKSDQRNKK